MTAPNAPSKKSTRGRKPEKAIALRRIQARDLLDQNFPAASALFADIGEGKLGFDEIQARLNEMAFSARQNAFPPSNSSFEDARSMNPEQAIARTFTALGKLADARLARRNLLAELDLARTSVALEMRLIDANEEHLRHELEAAFLTRPTIDREVQKRALEMERSGAIRANIILDSQRADAAWARPCNWSSLPSEIGNIKIRKRQPTQSVAGELLPPIDDIAFYIDEKVEPQMIQHLDASRLRKWYVQQVLGWISRNYPGKAQRPREAIASAWTALLMRKHPLFQQNVRQTSLLPSAWTPGEAMLLEIG